MVSDRARCAFHERSIYLKLRRFLDSLRNYRLTLYDLGVPLCVLLLLPRGRLDSAVRILDEPAEAGNNRRRLKASPQNSLKPPDSDCIMVSVWGPDIALPASQWLAT